MTTPSDSRAPQKRLRISSWAPSSLYPSESEPIQSSACSGKDICDIGGLKPGGKTYRRMRDAFTRLATTTYVAENVFLSNSYPKRARRAFETGRKALSQRRASHRQNPLPQDLWKSLPRLDQQTEIGWLFSERG